MNFYEMWTILEKETRVVGNTDPSTMAKTWGLMMPQEPVMNQLRMSEVWKITRNLSDQDLNRAWMYTVAIGSPIQTTSVYRERLTKIVKKEIRGVIEAEIGQEMDFHCRPINGNQGIESHVMIATTPMIYSKDDKVVLTSIIVHELRHSMDFHEMGNFKVADYTRDMGTHYEINMDDYARNIVEARAHVDQIKNLVYTMGGGEEAKKVLKESVLMRTLIPEIKQSMIEFIDLIFSTNESFENPAIVMKHEKHEVEQAVDLVQKICESFKFSNFVKII